MPSLTEHARRILETAEAAVACGEICSEMTILIGQNGEIRMLAESDWPLDSLALHYGVRAAYRVAEHGGLLRVEGRQGRRRCVLETKPLGSLRPT